MPPKNNKKGKHKKPKNASFPPAVPNDNALSGLPNVRRITVNYVTKRNLGVTGGFLETSFRANGPWDPDTQVGGTTSMSWPIWQLQYNHQVTLRSRIKVHLVRTSEDIAMGIYLADDATTPYSSLTGYMEAGRGTYSIVTKNLTSQKTVRSSFDCKEFFNCGDVKDRVATVGSATNAVPIDEATFIFWFDAIGTLPESTKVDVVVFIEYDVMFSEPQDIVTIISSFNHEERSKSMNCVEKPRCGSDLDTFDLGSNHSGEGHSATNSGSKPATALYKLW